MTLQQLYDLGVEMGMKADPRGAEGVAKTLAKLKKQYDELPEKKKKVFDPEGLKNPYADSRILFGDPKTEVKKLLAGIDAHASEVLLVDRLNEKGAKIDLLVTHHPEGHALAALYEVMDVQVDMYAQAGVPANVTYALLSERKNLVMRRFSPLNHYQAIDAARLLNIPLLGLHTIWDNLGNKFMTDYVGKKSYDTAGEVLDYIMEIPEFAEAAKRKNAPFLAAGSPNAPAGKVFVTFTGGTSPSKEMMVELAKAGVGTIVEMHVPEDSISELKKLHINVIDCGHMAADSIGANIYFDEVEKKGVEVVPGAGLIRVKRK